MGMRIYMLLKESLIYKYHWMKKKKISWSNLQLLVKTWILAQVHLLYAQTHLRVVSNTFSSIAKNYELKYTTDKDLIFNETAWSKLDIIQDKDILNGSLTPKEAGTMMELTINGTIFDFDYNETIYYMGLKAYDKSDQASELSNIATFTNAKESPPDEDDGLSGGAITGIVLGCLIVSALVIFGICVAKRTTLSAN